MKDHFSAWNSDWQPALLLYSWSNVLARKTAREPIQATTLRERTALLLKLIVLQLFRVLTVAGAPFSRLYAGTIWLGRNASYITYEMKRLVAAFIGWQAQKISPNSARVLDYDILPDFRRWHVSLGTSLQKFKCDRYDYVLCKDLLAFTGILLLGGFLWKCAQKAKAILSHASWRIRSLEQRMEEATSYEEWLALADDLDAIRDEQRRHATRPQELYDENLLAAKVNELQRLRDSRQLDQLVFSLRADLFRDFGNITNR
jgi:hypothetical protein